MRIAAVKIGQYLCNRKKNNIRLYFFYFETKLKKLQSRSGILLQISNHVQQIQNIPNQDGTRMGPNPISSKKKNWTKLRNY